MLVFTDKALNRREELPVVLDFDQMQPFVARSLLCSEVDSLLSFACFSDRLDGGEPTLSVHPLRVSGEGEVLGSQALTWRKLPVPGFLSMLLLAYLFKLLIQILIKLTNCSTDLNSQGVLGFWGFGVLGGVRQCG